MGATTFWTRVPMGTKGLNDVFRDLVSQARWDYGNSGYTGSIAEKSTFKVMGHYRTRKEADARADAILNHESMAEDSVVYDNSVSSKWGPAGVVVYQDGGEKWALFFGWASC